ncbi:hypothetical protein T4C_7439 [Trichinella pseudospiralis]|uniref:Uncharacterized protein n=1 Tax=Trichinella pseudospiralis TaxID=6337 RepID=A0A0V1GFB2_TRIPS|nr:hypothetical protein T4C_7439 [Trichinella pseudospiralis]
MSIRNYHWTATNLSKPFLTAYFFRYKKKSENLYRILRQSY